MASSTRDHAATDNVAYAYQPDAPHPTNPTATIGFGDIVGILQRGWYYPVLGCLLGLAVATAYFLFVPDLYKSSARILIDRSFNRYLQSNKVADQPTFDDSDTGSQIYVLSSDSIVVPVVRALKLTRDPEFVGPTSHNGADNDWSLRRLKSAIKQLAGFGSETELDRQTALERTAIEALLKRLSVYREDVANVISVTFSSEDPRKAAEIANALVDSYLAVTLENNFNSTKIASRLIQQRLMELKQQAATADQALQDFKAANHLVSAGKGLLSTEQMAGLSTQLTNARIAMAEAKARLDRLDQATKDGTDDAKVSDNEVIIKLRSQYLELSARASELEGRVGARHDVVVKLRKQMQELLLAVREEERRIGRAYASQYEFAKARTDELAAAMARLAAEAGSSSHTQVTMLELESSAETLRNLYNSFLQKFNEMHQVQAHPIPVQDARIITRAAPPLHKNSKKTFAVLGGSLALGLLLGLGAAFARELTDDVFRTPEQVKTATNIYSTLFPTVEALPEQTGQPHGASVPGLLEEHVLDAPYSRFAEAARNVSALITAARRMRGEKVVCIVSSVAKEGKTTVAANLATLIASTSKSRVLIIDGDLHRRTLSARLAPDAVVGLIEALDDPQRLTSYVTQRERTGLHVLPCLLPARIPNAAELLGSRQMELLLETARAAYDLVIVEVAPIMSVADVKMIERCIDSFVFVIEWGKTKQRLVHEALSEAEGIRDRLLCVVLNKADPAALRSFEAYKGARFKDYYEG